MERRRTEDDTRRGATFGYSGRAPAAPVLASALRRITADGTSRAAVLLADHSGESFQSVDGSLRRCRDWLSGFPTDSGVGVLCVAPSRPAAAHKASGLTLRGHLSLAAVGSLGAFRPSAAETSEANIPLAERLADLVERHWIPPLQLSVSRALTGLEGEFHAIAMTAHEPGRIVCTSRGSSLCIGAREAGVIVCSEPDVVLSETGRVAFLHSGEIGVLDADGWDLLAGDALARLRRPIVDPGWYRAWARRRTMAPGPHAPPFVEPHQSADERARVAQGGR